MKILILAVILAVASAGCPFGFGGKTVGTT
jgi:hypothetical protein